MQKQTILPLIAVGTLSSLGVGLLGPVYPIFVVNRFSASLIDLGLLYTIILLTAALVKAPAGRLVDLYGKEKIFFTGLMLGATCTLAYTFVSNILQLYFGIILCNWLRPSTSCTASVHCRRKRQRQTRIAFRNFRISL